MSASIEHTRRNRVLMVISCASAAAVIFAAYAAQIVNQFYVVGAPAYDAGWFAFLLNHFDFPPANPLYVQERGIPSFFAFHVAPIMPLWGAMAGALGLSPTVSMALFQGFFHALAFLTGVGIAKTSLPQPWNAALRMFVGLALAFSPIVLDAIRFPHHEVAFSVLFIASCLAYSRQRCRLAALLFLVALFVRTDSGFHASCFLFAFAAAELSTKRRLTWPIKLALICGAVALVYSICAFAVGQFWFPQFSNFRLSYVGNRFDHISAVFVFERLVGLLALRPELFAILLLPLGVGWLKRDLAICFGSLAILPWLCLHLAAYRDIPGQLYTYYAFPFQIVIAWPWLAPLLRGTDESNSPAPNDTLAAIAFAAFCAIGWFVYFTTPFSAPRDTAEARERGATLFVPRTGPIQFATVTNFAGAYQRVMERHGAITYLDAAMQSLVPSSSRTRLLDLEITDAPDVFVVAYFSTGDHGRGVGQSRYLQQAESCYDVSGTHIRVLARGATGLVTSELAEFVSVSDCVAFRD